MRLNPPVEHLRRLPRLNNIQTEMPDRASEHKSVCQRIERISKRERVRQSNLKAAMDVRARIEKMKQTQAPPRVQETPIPQAPPRVQETPMRISPSAGRAAALGKFLRQKGITPKASAPAPSVQNIPSSDPSITSRTRAAQAIAA